MIDLHKIRFVVGQFDYYWSAGFSDFYAFLERGAAGGDYDLDKEPGFRYLKTRPKWLQTSYDRMCNDKWSNRLIPRGGYIEVIDWDANDYKEYLDEIDDWQKSLLTNRIICPT